MEINLENKSNSFEEGCINFIASLIAGCIEGPFNEIEIQNLSKDLFNELSTKLESSFSIMIYKELLKKGYSKYIVLKKMKNMIDAILTNTDKNGKVIKKANNRKLSKEEIKIAKKIMQEISKSRAKDEIRDDDFDDDHRNSEDCWRRY